MSFAHTSTDHSPLCYESEMIVANYQMLVEQVGYLMLGKHRHVASILAAKNGNSSSSTDKIINRAQRQLQIKSTEERYKRDGWLFQMMTWISIRIEYNGVKVYSQAPHDNPAQHGIDGLSIILTSNNKIKSIIIEEDKYTENPRPTIKNQVWPEFKLFEKGEFDSQLVSRTSILLAHLSDDEINEIIENDIYKSTKRIYRAGITPLDTAKTPKKRKKLFKGYDGCVSGIDHGRRQALTFSQTDIRKWMDDFSLEIYDFLEKQRP
ncbi:hypothetical protein PBT90_02465 [Algoriphagus halophytocola]|uniref:hypothetical protein n=1 Tax=Algoriphagus halophytocola TaxID=2991499 RepID=UPI0022DE6FE1|nr:hypothetical protein [Algoriphagus sp. TR-M9]WBL43555.1 hypothetical protein PBT90_02465 [Algoriphagus sp. TR-M9]